MKLLTVIGQLSIKPFLALLVLVSVVPSVFAAVQIAGDGARIEAGIVVGASLIAVLMITSSRLERSRVERALASKQRQNQAILDASADAYVGMDARGRITAWSGQAEQTFGWRADEVIGAAVSSTIVPPDLRSAHENGLRHYLSTGVGPVLGKRVELEAIHRDGNRFPIELAVWAAQGENETVFVSFIHDITERRHKEHELASARDQAMEASRLKSEFLANMSHEIRTPMNGVIGMVNLLFYTDLTTEQRHYAETVQSSAEALLLVLNDILDFSKIEAGHLTLVSGPFDPRLVVEEVGDLLASTALAKNVELLTFVDPQLPATVTGDSGRLRQILLNLASNAVKFTDSGEVVIQLVQVDQGNGRPPLYRFEVADTGPGIAPEDRGRLFESFAQLDTSSTRRHGGTGLGLAISKRLVELLGGNIGFDSVVGKGSTFWFELELETGKHVAGDTAPRTLSGVRVLIADDNETNRVILDRTLDAEGIESTSADSAALALTLLRSAAAKGRPFHVALLDYDMPEMNGMQLAKEMEADDALRSTRRILLASSGPRPNEVNADEAGIQAFLTKPVRHAQLLAEIGRAAQNAPSPQTKAKPAARSANSTAGLRVLVAEDNLVNQQVARLMLEKLGYKIDVVANGYEAIDAWERTPYDVVFMDCQMPDLDGYAATKQIRLREKPGQHVPIIAVTAHAMEGDAERCFRSGMDDYLPKPASPEAIESMMDKWLSGNSSATPTSAASDEPASADSALDAVMFDKLKQIFDDSDDDFDNMVDLYLQKTSDDLAALHSAMTNGDIEAVTHIAHRMKGSCDIMGATRMSSVCAVISGSSHAGNERLSQLCAELNARWLELQPEIKKAQNTA